MKKTLFLSAILATALCSSAFAETITVAGTEYTNAAIITEAQATVSDASYYLFANGSGNDMKVQNNGDSNPWVTSLDSSKTIISAPATSGETNYSGSRLWFDTGAQGDIVVNANIIAGGSGSDDLRFWSNTDSGLVAHTIMKGSLTIVGSKLQLWNHHGTQYLEGTLNGANKELLIVGSESSPLLMLSGGGTLGKLNMRDAASSVTLSATNYDGTSANGKTYTIGTLSGGAGKTLTIDQGVTANISSKLESFSGTIANNGTLNFNGKLLVAGGTSTINGTGAVNVNNKNGTYVVQLDSAAKLTLANGGTYDVSSATTGTAVSANGVLTLSNGTELITKGIMYSVSLNSNGDVVVNNGATLTLKGGVTGSSKGAACYTRLNQLKVLGTSTIAGESDIAILTVGGSLTAKTDHIVVRDYLATEYNGKVTISDGAVLAVSDNGSGKGIWLNEGVSLTIKDTAHLAIGASTQTDTVTTVAETLTIASNSKADAVISRLNSKGTAKLGIAAGSNTGFLKNVKVSNAAINYTGSEKLLFGSLENSSLVTAGADTELVSLTLSGQTITLGEDHTGYLTTSGLTVTAANSTINANLIVSANGTMDFSGAIATGTTLTMGCSVEIGNNVTVVIDESIIEGIVNRGETVAIITNVDAITSLENKTWHFQNAAGQSLDQYALRLEDDGHGNIVVAPEPATATLSLLALAGLCARRRRH